MARVFILICLISFTGAKDIFSQNTGQIQKRNIAKGGAIQPNQVQEDWHPVLQSLEMPVPGSEWEEMLRIKEKVRERFPLRTRDRKKMLPDTAQADPFNIGKSFEGNPFNSGVPNDNNIAIADNNLLISVINSTILAYDLPNDSSLFLVSLAAFSDTLGLPNSKYDPKVVYDPTQDKFIIVFLNGTNSSTSNIVVAFSSSSDPTDPWHLYALPGNPFQDTTWSDYPAIALTQNEFFITVNQLHDGQSWQNGFKQTIIWQIDKSTGYAGKDSLSTQLWSEIEYDSQYVRYLHPVQGGISILGPDLYFLSNRNFAVQKDTIFIAHLADTIGSASNELTVKPAITDISYGMPPNGQQANNQELATNDARMLGAFIKETQVQFVNNTIDTTTGRAAVYHGVIPDVTQPVPQVDGHIIGDTVLDFGYPNIAFAGNQLCEDEAIITFNHTAATVPAGCSGIYFSNNHNYSERITLKSGGGHINHLFSSVERWGDYSGLQRKYDRPGTVWFSGMWGDSSNNQATWIAELTTPDTAAVLVTQLIDSSDQSLYGECDGTLKATVTGGHPPYQYRWNDPDSQTTTQATGLCKGTYTVSVTDALGCTYTSTGKVGEPAPQTQLFPNPAHDQASVHFNLKAAAEINIEIYDRSGQLVKLLLSEQAKPGRNVFTFSTDPLAKGVYILKVQGKDLILTKKLVKL